MNEFLLNTPTKIGMAGVGADITLAVFSAGTALTANTGPTYGWPMIENVWIRQSVYLHTDSNISSAPSHEICIQGNISLVIGYPQWKLERREPKSARGYQFQIYVRKGGFE